MLSGYAYWRGDGRSGLTPASRRESFAGASRQPASGGVTPWKKIHEIASPTQTTKPNRLTT